MYEYAISELISASFQSDSTVFRNDNQFYFQMRVESNYGINCLFLYYIKLQRRAK